MSFGTLLLYDGLYKTRHATTDRLLDINLYSQSLRPRWCPTHRVALSGKTHSRIACGATQMGCHKLWWFCQPLVVDTTVHLLVYTGWSVSHNLYCTVVERLGVALQLKRFIANSKSSNHPQSSPMIPNQGATRRQAALGLPLEWRFCHGLLDASCASRLGRLGTNGFGVWGDPKGVGHWVISITAWHCTGTAQATCKRRGSFRRCLAWGTFFHEVFGEANSWSSVASWRRGSSFGRCRSLALGRELYANWP